MFNFFLPRRANRILSDAELISINLRRNRIYSQDILSDDDLAAALELEKRYQDLIKTKDIDELEKLNEESVKTGSRIFPPSPWDGWRENVEVFVVIAILAISLRTYFLQQFKIPTGSMEPTLYGIEPRPSAELPPNVFTQAWDFLIRGKSYSRVVTRQGGTISEMVPGSFTMWFEYTDVHLADGQGNNEVDRIWIRSSDVTRRLHIDEGMQFQPGAVLTNYTTQTGDEVLVDKVTYNFRPPRRGEVFVFTTAGIPGLAGEGNSSQGSQDYIKRCVGLAGDLIEVKPPFLYVNGRLATGASTFEKEFTRTHDYPGYTLISSNSSAGATLDDNTQSYYVPVDCYWAMGDNSPNSLDSRYWGGVPRQNLIGRGYFVFWPFTERWGWIK